jgi:hypothetical protein
LKGLKWQQINFVECGLTGTLKKLVRSGFVSLTWAGQCETGLKQTVRLL